MLGNTAPIIYEMAQRAVILQLRPRARDGFSSHLDGDSAAQATCLADSLEPGLSGVDTDEWGVCQVPAEESV